MPAPSAPRAASTRPCPAARECRVPPVVRAGVGRCGRGCRRSGYAGSGARRRCARVRCSSAPESSAPCVARRRSGGGSGAARGRWSTSVCGWPRPSASPGHSSARLWSHQGGRALSPSSIAGEGRKSAMSNQRLMKAKEKAGDGYAKTNAIARRGGLDDPRLPGNTALGAVRQCGSGRSLGRDRQVSTVRGCVSLLAESDLTPTHERRHRRCARCARAMGRQHRFRRETTTRPRRAHRDDSEQVRSDRYSQFTWPVRQITAYLRSHQHTHTVNVAVSHRALPKPSGRRTRRGETGVTRSDAGSRRASRNASPSRDRTRAQSSSALEEPSVDFSSRVRRRNAVRGAG